MSAARHTTPPPDMTGLTGDWKRMSELRKDSDSPSDQDQAPEDDATASRLHDATGQGPDVTEEAPATEAAKKPRKPGPKGRRDRRTAPKVTDAVALTVRVDVEEADAIDDWVLDLRAETAQRLDKSEVIRELLILGRDHPSTRRALLRRLNRPTA